MISADRDKPSWEVERLSAERAARLTPSPLPGDMIRDRGKRRHFKHRAGHRELPAGPP